MGFILHFASNAFARIGEITVKDHDSKVLQLADISIASAKGQLNSVAVTFRYFKHNLSATPDTITFGHGPTESSAVKSVFDYIQLRGSHEGPLFCLASKKPVTRLIFDRYLHRALSFCRLDSKIYKGLSFRIGAATLAVENNISDAQIRGMDRWSSNTFRKYIRISGN